MSVKIQIDWKSIIYRGVESEELDYKAALDWRKLNRGSKAKFVRHCLAMANTKGGYIVVGVGEDSAGQPSLMSRSAGNSGFSPLDRSPVGQRGTAEDLLKNARKVIRIVVAEFRRHLFHAEGCGVQAVACRLHAQADVVLHRR